MEFKVTERHYTMQVSLDEIEARKIIDQITTLYPCIISMVKDKKCQMSDYVELLQFKDKLALSILE